MPKLPRTVNFPVPAKPTRYEIIEGLRITAPVAAGYIPLGLAYGVLVIQLGLPWWLAPALSLSAYSGSAELLVVTLAAQNTPLAVIAVTMLLVNFRLLFFAFSFPLHVIEGRVARLFSMYALVDEAYALTAARPNGWTKPRLLAMQVLFNLTWVTSSLVGVSAGSLIPTQIEGLDFALTALFITLTLDAARTRRTLPSVLLAAHPSRWPWWWRRASTSSSHSSSFVACLSARHFCLQLRLGIVSRPRSPTLGRHARGRRARGGHIRHGGTRGTSARVSDTRGGLVTPSLPYLLAILAIVFVIDFTLRALPFKILEPLRDSRFVSDMAVWMPPGIMLILVFSTLSQGMQVAGGRWWAALVATGITVAVHLLSGRKLLWSVGIGTLCYIALLNWL